MIHSKEFKENVKIIFLSYLYFLSNCLIQQKLFSDLYLAKFLDALSKPFFLYTISIFKLGSESDLLTNVYTGHALTNILTTLLRINSIHFVTL